jgi:hypothetical protein
MTPRDLAPAKDPDLRVSLQAMHRAAELARQTAIQTGTDLVIVENQQIVRISAEQLQRARAQHEG